MALSESVKGAYHAVVDERLRDSLWALRTRRDGSVLSGVVRGVVGASYPVGQTTAHLAATIDWLCAAQDAIDGGGVAAFYDVRSGTWGPPYPETTGYIIPTFYDVAAWSGDGSYRNRASRMADWLLGLQLESGAFPIGPLWPGWERRPIVFDTGQILHGLVRAFEETTQSRYLDSAVRAGDWLCEIQEADGCWRRCTSSGSAHTYNVRSAWGILRLHQVSGLDRHRDAAARNLRWAIAQQDTDQWFRHMEFREGEDPLTHTIAYTIEGILESGILLADQSLVDAARRAADVLVQKQREHGWLRGRYGPGWRPSGRWSCVTGNAQMALVWYRLHQLTERDEYLDAARAANRSVKQWQCRTSQLAGVRGGVPGSWPLFGEYEPYRNLNWAAKFFVDSLLLERRLAAAT
jgi:hypothetical protein